LCSPLFVPPIRRFLSSESYTPLVGKSGTKSEKALDETTYVVYYPGMAKQQKYASVELPPRRRAAVARIAKAEGRALAKQAGLLIEMGLTEYQRRKEQAGEPRGVPQTKATA
jgi:hypothetical protein